MVKIRLQRTGKRNRPHYRLVAIESRNPRDGAVLEVLGYYDPIKEEFAVKLERVDEWLSKGAQLTPRAKSLVKLARKAQIESSAETETVEATIP